MERKPCLRSPIGSGRVVRLFCSVLLNTVIEQAHAEQSTFTLTGSSLHIGGKWCQLVHNLPKKANCTTIRRWFQQRAAGAQLGRRRRAWHEGEFRTQLEHE